MRIDAKFDRRNFLRQAAVVCTLAPLAIAARRRAIAADAPLLSEEDPQAKALGYVEDAKNAKGATPNSRCANCGLYQGDSKASVGPCQLFPGKQVKAAGWCSSWAPQM